MCSLSPEEEMYLNSNIYYCIPQLKCPPLNRHSKHSRITLPQPCSSPAIGSRETRCLCMLLSEQCLSVGSRCCLSDCSHDTPDTSNKQQTMVRSITATERPLITCASSVWHRNLCQNSVGHSRFRDTDDNFPRWIIDTNS